MIYSFFCARPFDQKLGSSLIYLFYLYVQDYSTKIRGHSYSLICSFLIVSIFCTIVFFTILYCPCISYDTFMSGLPLYFVRYIHGYTKSLPLRLHIAMNIAYEIQGQYCHECVRNIGKRFLVCHYELFWNPPHRFVSTIPLNVSSSIIDETNVNMSNLTRRFALLKLKSRIDKFLLPSRLFNLVLRNVDINIS